MVLELISKKKINITLIIETQTYYFLFVIWKSKNYLHILIKMFIKYNLYRIKCYVNYLNLTMTV